jgi:hypothetical protein
MTSTLSLFGLPLQFEDTGTTYDTLTHGSKTYVCKVAGTFRNSKKTLFELEVDGDLPSGRVKFHQQFVCVVNGGVIRLMGSGAILKPPQITLLLGKPYPSAIVTVEPDPSGSFGVVIVDRFSPLTNYLTGSINNDGIDNVSISPISWGDTSLFFDIPNSWCRAIPSKTDVYFDDFFKDEDGRGINKQQTLLVQEMIIDSAALEIHAAPASGALMLHPDILNTKNVLPSDDKSSNDFLYQYALVNGRLSWNIPFRRESDGSQIRWTSADGSEPGMVVFRHRDEHGNPILLVPGEATNGFRIGFRVGVQHEIAASYDPTEWELTNRAACVVLDQYPDGTQIPLDCELRGMDPITLYGRPRHTKDDPFDKPYWLTDGKVVYAPRVPLELHGLLKGTYLRCSSAAAENAWQNELTGHNAQLVVKPVMGSNHQKIFHKSEIILSNSLDWEVVAEIEERQVYSGISTTLSSATTAIPKRVAKSTSSHAVRLPLIDTSYALANLAGVERKNIDGNKLGDAPILSAGIEWLSELNDQFTQGVVYSAPTLKENTHVSGRGLIPSNEQPFETVICFPPTTARSIHVTALPGPTMLANVLPQQFGMRTGTANSLNSFESVFHYGGTRDSHSQKNVESERNSIDTLLTPIRSAFFNQFLDPEGLSSSTQEKEALIAFKRYLVGERPYNAANGQDIAPDAFFTDMLRRAIDLLENEVPIPGINDDELDFLRSYLNTIDAQQFEDFWRGRIDDNFLRKVINFVFAPLDNQLFRRAVSAIYPEIKDLTKPVDPNSVAEELRGHFEVLRTKVLPFQPADLMNFQKLLGGFPIAIEEGIDALQLLAREIWKDHQNTAMDSLRREFGPYLTDDVYAALLERTDQAAQFLAILKEANEFFEKLKSLGDLKTFKPEYLFFTKRFKTKQLGSQANAEALWSQKFELCRLGDTIKWNFFLDSEASVLVKLTDKKTLPELLGTLEAEYKTPSRPNPLGLPPLPHDASESGDQTPLSKFIDLLHPDLKKANWTGVLVIAPMADISEDIVLRDLAGLEYIQAAYAAIGGAKPYGQDAPDLDVIASIFKEETKPKQLSNTQATRGDLDFALVKFDVTIKNTKIEDGCEIVFRLDPQTLWGRSWRDEQSDTEKKKSERRMFVRGTIPKEDKASGEEKTPPTFEFAASFEPPKTIDIDVAFIKSFTLKSIRVGRNKGRTAMEIDGQTNFQKYSVLGIEIFKEGDDKVEPLQLSDFRIFLPSLSGGKQLDFGVFRDLDFDFPSIKFAIPRPRGINLWGIEIIPKGLGFFRRSMEKGFKELETGYNWLEGWKLGKAADGLSVPLIEFTVDFGKLPEFGGSNLKGLKFQLALAIGWQNNDVKWTALGLSGLDAKDITIDLFRLLTLKIGEFKLDSFEVEDPKGTGKTTAGGILAKDVELKLLNWSPLPENSELSMLLLQPSHSQPDGNPDSRTKQDKAGLVYYGIKSPDDVKDDFLKIFWILIAHNLALDPKVLNYLMFEGGNGDYTSIMDDIVPRANGKRGTMSWLAGIAFGLGDILEECSFVLHDKHYYGIRLSADWVEPIFGQRTIELAYIPGTAPQSDRFRTNLRLPFLDMIGVMRSGEFALEWAPNWDFLIDIGFPWKTKNGADWFRAFAAGQGVEAKMGFYFDKRTELVPTGAKTLTISAGMGYYAGYYWGSGNGTAYVRAGIGVFAILEGKVTFENAKGGNPLRGAIVRLDVTGVIGIFAYGEGGIDVWILSARFRVAAIAAIEAQVLLQRGSPASLNYTAYLYAYYSASVRVGSGPFKWTFRVKGRIGTEVAGKLLLN